jgi:nitroreductase
MAAFPRAEDNQATTVTEAVVSRRSCRAFTTQRVDLDMVRRLLEIARQAPSGGNLQPWCVHVLAGDALARFRAMMAPKIAASPLGGASEYSVYPPHVKEPYRSRRFKVGEDMYGHIGIRREDKAGRIRQFARNFDFFGAPVGMFFLIDRTLGAPQWSDLGMFIQTLMLLAREAGLETCPQEAWASWHREVTEFIGAPPEMMLFCGLALGYGDYSSPINQLRSERAPIEEFVTVHD